MDAVITAADVAAQERELVLPSLSEDDALDLGALLVARARERRLPVAVEIRRGARVLFRAALPGTAPDNDDWLARKARVVERFGRSTLGVRLRYEERGTTFEDATGLAPTEYAAHGGGFPLAVAGTGVVGFAGVSGLPQLEDHAFLVEVLREHLASRGG